MKKKKYQDDVEKQLDDLMYAAVERGDNLLHACIFDAYQLYEKGNLDLLTKFYAYLDVFAELHIKPYEPAGYALMEEYIREAIGNAIESLNSKQNNGDKKAMFKVI
ncbi:hypothetical protein COE50_22395 [Bacillus anthracis]|nr:hypothetical protein COE50_22395 [Bacillus anthracis]